MVKLILNKDTEHYINASDINYNAGYKINRYSIHSENFVCFVESATMSNLLHFENVPIEVIDIYDANDNLTSSLVCGEHFYLMSSHIEINENNTKLFVSFNTAIPTSEEEEEGEE